MPLFNAPKKHVLNYFALEMAAFFLLGGTAENRELVVELRDMTFCTSNIFGMQEEHKNIFCQAI